MPSKSYKELYEKALLMIECFSRRYETPSHETKDWDIIITNVSKEELHDYIEELKGEEEIVKD